MMTSTDPDSSEYVPIVSQAAASSDWTTITPGEPSLDLYAESELQMRHERTERMIRRAEEQAT